ncbi:unnamed protein product [Cuscuta europaea]|uniref:Uncharacterized protein n=1 Tax=Cuscuta europaea TaxID=41803 RepID=A0A9P1EP31_CUSEU|nr:unnamed protein product [Cuscuta europaea]
MSPPRNESTKAGEGEPVLKKKRQQKEASPSERVNEQSAATTAASVGNETGPPQGGASTSGISPIATADTLHCLYYVTLFCCVNLWCQCLQCVVSVLSYVVMLHRWFKHF